MTYEYRVIPAPDRGDKTKGIKAPQDRFAHTLQELMNQMGVKGWEFQRAETLPSIERSGLASTTTNYRNVLVFRRPLTAQNGEKAARPLSAQSPVDSVPAIKPVNNSTEAIDNTPEQKVRAAFLRASRDS